MRRLLILLCAFWMSSPLVAQTLDTGLVTGTWDDGQAPAGWATRFSWQHLDMAEFGARIPAGRSLFSWDSFLVQGYGVGLSLDGPSSWYAAAGITQPAELPIHWNGSDYTWKVSATAGALVVNKTGNLIWGGADGEAGGMLAWKDQFDLGPFQAGARLAFAGLWGLGGFVAEGNLNFQSNFSILGASPIDAQGTLQVWASGVWAHQQWKWSWGSFDVFAAGGLFWVPQGDWRITSFETKFVLGPPWVTTVSTKSEYRFEADPGWLFVLKPTVTWNLGSVWSLEASRWIPFVTGWSLTQGATVLSKASSGETSSSAQTAVNWLLAGTSVAVHAQW